MEGSYSFITPEGDEIAVSYTADENGYYPTVKNFREKNMNLLTTFFRVTASTLHSPELWSTSKDKTASGEFKEINVAELGLDKLFIYFRY